MTLDEILKLYIFPEEDYKKEWTIDFLKKNERIIPFLNEASVQIKKYFPDDYKLYLGVGRYPDCDEYLVLDIGVRESVETEMERLEMFDLGWGNNNYCKNVTIVLRYEKKQEQI